MMHPRIPRPLLIPIALFATLAAGCNQNSGPDLTAEVQRLSSELEATRLKLDAAEKTVVTKRADVAIAVAPSPVKKETLEAAPAVVTHDEQLRTLQAELVALKKRDAFVFAEASAALQSGASGTALTRYEQFLKDFPNSPLATDADRAIAELTTAAQREARARATMIDPRRPERDLLQRFNDGAVTINEISPLLKNRSQADVVKLLGQPNQTYRDGKEIGYVDKVIDTATGSKGTLVIGFESDAVSTLRIGYLGKPVKP